MDGGSYSTTYSKKLACKSSARTAIAKIKVVDNASNPGSSGGTKCDNYVSVPGCCDSGYKGSWVNGTTCYRDGKKVTCDGGHYHRYKYSTLNGQECEKEKEAGSKCATKSCCSASNYTGCKKLVSCRNGNTAVFTSSSMSTWAGVVRHTSGYTNYLYLLDSSGGKYKVRASGLYEDYGYGKVVWIYKKCTGSPGSYCGYSQCPG